MSCLQKLLLAVSAALLSTAASAQIGFGPTQSVAGPPNLLANPIILIDLDGDHGHDVLQPYILAGVSGLARNTGSGFPGLLTVPALPLTGTLTASDVNADGIEDVVSHSQAGIQVILGSGHGRFDSPITSPGPHLTFDLAVEDFDNDGFPDVLMFGGQLFSGEIDFRQGLGDGSFGPEQVIVPFGMGASSLGATGDLDGDGLLDAVVTTGLLGTSPKIFSLLNRGGGSFEVVEETLPTTPAAMTLTDLDGNGAADLVLHGSSGLRVLEGLGDGSFTPAQTITFAGFGSAAVDDFDRDGHPDIAYLSGSPGMVQIFRQSQALQFEQAGTSGGWPGSAVLLSADVDHDGFPDLLAAGMTSGFSWARNRATTTPHTR